MRKTLGLCLMGLGLACIVVALLVPSSTPSDNPCPAGNSSIIHAPASGVCPQGFQLHKGFFSESDGSTRSACVSNIRGDGSTDCLMPGEGMHITVEIPTAEPDRDKI